MVPSKTVVVTVNPTPQVIPSPVAQTLCNDGTTNVILNSPSTFTSGLITFNYTVVATGGVTGFSTPVSRIAKGSHHCRYTYIILLMILKL